MRQAWLCISLYVCTFAAAALGQCAATGPRTPDSIGDEVGRIYNETLDGMRHTLPSGVVATTWRAPSDSVRAQIECLGPAAVPAIIELLQTSHRSFGPYLAVRMLGWAGGPGIVPPLAEILSRSGDPLVGLKIEALESLVSAPPDKALPIVQKVLRTEKNGMLLQQAASVEARLEGQLQDGTIR